MKSSSCRAVFVTGSRWTVKFRKALVVEPFVIGLGRPLLFAEGPDIRALVVVRWLQWQGSLVISRAVPRESLMTKGIGLLILRRRESLLGPR